MSIPRNNVSDDKNFLIPLVEVSIETSSVYRASESVADLRNVAEILYHPFRTVGFWDQSSGEHLCPHTQYSACRHTDKDTGKQAYRQTVVDELDGLLEVWFPEAGLSIFLS